MAGHPSSSLSSTPLYETTENVYFVTSPSPVLTRWYPVNRDSTRFSTVSR